MKTFIHNILHRYHLKDYKFSLVVLVLAISVIGVFIVGSAQASSQGKQAMGVIRYRHDNVREDGVMPGYANGDLGRTETQQKLLGYILELQA